MEQGGTQEERSLTGLSTEDAEQDANATFKPDCPTIDLALVEAMRVPRDKAFVVRHEKDMEDKIRDDSISEWELPLMNSYQRLLVHRIADHFQLSHSIDQGTKQVTLTKQDHTRIPPASISTLAESERLSEPAAFPPLLSSLSGQSTPSGSGTPGPSVGFRIMRREAGASGSRSDSSRNGTATPEEGGSMRKDRRNMTIEEREAAYREARQRIFGSEGNGESAISTPSNDGAAESGVDGVGGTRKESRKTSSTRSATPSCGTSSDCAGLSSRNPTRAEDNYLPGDATSNPALQYISPTLYDLPTTVRPRHAGFGYPATDQQQFAYYTQAGAYPAPQIQIDAQGRPLMAQSWPYPQYPLVAGQVFHYGIPSDYAHSPGASSRSTSISTGTEGGESARSSISEQNMQQQHLSPSAPAPLNVSSLQGTPVNRSQSVSPTVSYPHRTPPHSGNVTPGGTAVYPTQGPAPGGPWPLVYPGSASQLHFPPSASPYASLDYANAMRNGSVRPNGSANPVPPPASLYSPGYGRMPFQASGTPPNGMATGPYFPGTGGQTGQPGGMRAEENGMHTAHGVSRGRGRMSHGNERSLYDPNKPTATTSPATASSGNPCSNGRHSLGKSSSAAAVLENGGFVSNRRDALPATMTGMTSMRSAVPGQGLRSTSSSSVRSSGQSSASGAGSTFSLPSHPSLPARPDWAMTGRQTGGSSSQASTTPSNYSTISENVKDAPGTPTKTDTTYAMAASDGSGTVITSAMQPQPPSSEAGDKIIEEPDCSPPPTSS